LKKGLPSSREVKKGATYRFGSLAISSVVLGLVVVVLSLLYFANSLFGGLITILSAYDASVIATLAALSGYVDISVYSLADRSYTSLGSSSTPRLFKLLSLSITSSLGSRPTSYGTTLRRHIDKLLKGYV
jgi:hypothetical protein